MVIEKNVGETPLTALRNWRDSTPDLSLVPLTYAGRLDPMASGKLLVLIGDECKKKDAYNALDKEYEFEVLFGASSDTGDILGLAEKCSAPTVISQEKVSEVASALTGEHTMSYPHFSSKTVNGIPLFQYALEDRLYEIQIPTMEIQLYRLTVGAMKELSSLELLAEIREKLSLLQIDEESENPFKDFRRTEILERWAELLSNETEDYRIVSLRVVVSSGTYIRSLAPLIAENLGACGLAFSIHRSKIGRYLPMGKRFGFWTKRY